MWDAARGVTSSMRGKEEAHDYRYFPDPDLVPIVVDANWVKNIQENLPELPDAKKARFIREYGLPEYDAEVLTSSKPLAHYYEASLLIYAKPKIVSNWIMSELLRELKRDEREIEECPVIRVRGAQGIEATGQRIIFMLAQLFVFLLSLVPAAVVFGALFFAFKLLVPPALAMVVGAFGAALVLAVEAFVGVVLLGKLFERLDLSTEHFQSAA